MILKSQFCEGFGGEYRVESFQVFRVNFVKGLKGEVVSLWENMGVMETNFLHLKYTHSSSKALEIRIKTPFIEKLFLEIRWKL